MFPVSQVVVEDIKAKTKGQRKWDASFSPLQVGKKWFYAQISNFTLKRGYETAALRDAAGLKKSKSKLAERFDAHCVDSWVLANHIVGGHTKPDNEHMLLITPLRFHRRQLHVFQFTTGGIRRDYGGTRSLGFKRGSLVKHSKYGVCYVGGTSKGRVTLHSISTGARLSRAVKAADCTFVTFNSWRTQSL